jgi:hypothetical protein
MTMQTRGFGAARKPANVAPIDRYCISPQLAPSTLSAKDKAVFARSEDYHAGRIAKDSGRK